MAVLVVVTVHATTIGEGIACRPTVHLHVGDGTLLVGWIRVGVCRRIKLTGRIRADGIILAQRTVTRGTEEGASLARVARRNTTMLGVSFLNCISLLSRLVLVSQFV